MASTGTYWSGESSHMKVGLVVRWNDIGAGTTSSTVYVDFYVQSQAWGFNDAQTINFSGSLGGSWNYTMSSGSGATVTLFVGTYTVGTYSTSYSGGPSFTFGAYLTGVYAGTGPSISIGWTLPARPASAPNSPGIPAASDITSSGATLTWTASGTNGSSVTAYQLQVATDSGYSNIVSDSSANNTSRSVASLAHATTHYVRVRANSSAGYSGWSSSGSFTTLAVAPDPPTGLIFTNITQSSTTLSWTAPADNGGSAVTQYHIQRAENPTFSTNPVDYYTSGTTYNLTDLMPLRGYYLRVAATNSIGTGSWSSTASFTSSAAAHVKVSGTWQPVKVWVKASGTWYETKVWKKVSGSWIRNN